MTQVRCDTKKEIPLIAPQGILPGGGQQGGFFTYLPGVSIELAALPPQSQLRDPHGSCQGERFTISHD